MGHDTEAAFAAAEISKHFQTNPSDCFSISPQSISSYPTMAGKTWPVPDSVITVDANNKTFSIALEYKRENEGLHGILTAIGQSLAYLSKGFDGSVIVVPKVYKTLPAPGEFIKDVLKNSSPGKPVGVFTYDKPNTSHISPFADKIKCNRPVSLGKNPTSKKKLNLKSKSLWAHLREGDSYPDVFFKYLLESKKLNPNTRGKRTSLPPGLVAAVSRIDPSKDVYMYLSDSTGINFHDKVWRSFWFKYVLTKDVASIWKTPRRGRYETNESPLNLKL